MYYSAGTYESFAHPEKPKDVDKKSAYIIGTGLAGLTAAMAEKTSQRGSSCVAVGKWTITLK